MKAALPLTEILERDWDRQLFADDRKPGLATQLGWKSHWTFNSRGSAHGFPDRTVARDRVIFVELKRELTSSRSVNRQRDPSEMQVAWLDRLATAGAEVYLWRPSDLDEIARILTGRWTLIRADDGKPPLLAREGPGPYFIDEWTPGSMWLAGVGRADSLVRHARER